MTTQRIRIVHPATGDLVRVCRGPTASGGCPLAGPDGVVPCAGFSIAPEGGDEEYWPLRVPVGYRHCDVPWNELARTSLRQAEVARRRWRAGRDRETARVRFLAVHRDPRYRKMTDRELCATALWRWRLSAAGQALRRSEQKSQEQADTYLRFVEYRRAADSVSA